MEVNDVIALRPGTLIGLSVILGAGTNAAVSWISHKLTTDESFDSDAKSPDRVGENAIFETECLVLPSVFRVRTYIDSYGLIGEGR